MKVLAIIGSLRKGNTYRTVQAVEKLHKESMECEYEYVFLKDLNLGLCNGCFVCIAKGEQFCPLKDGRDELVMKIESADAVILASPNYVANVPWIMKNFIDRFAYTAHRPKYFNQKFMLIINGGSYIGIKKAMKAISILVSGGKTVSRLTVYNSPGMNEKKIKKQEAKIKKATDTFVKSLREKKNAKPPFSFLIWFSAFKASSVMNKEHIMADYEFFKDKDYFTDCKLNVFQRATIKIFVRFFVFLIKKGFI